MVKCHPKRSPFVMAGHGAPPSLGLCRCGGTFSDQGACTQCGNRGCPPLHRLPLAGALTSSPVSSSEAQVLDSPPSTPITSVAGRGAQGTTVTSSGGAVCSTGLAALDSNRWPINQLPEFGARQWGAQPGATQTSPHFARRPEGMGSGGAPPGLQWAQGQAAVHPPPGFGFGGVGGGVVAGQAFPSPSTQGVQYPGAGQGAQLPQAGYGGWTPQGPPFGGYPGFWPQGFYPMAPWPQPPLGAGPGWSGWKPRASPVVPWRPCRR